MVIPLVIAGAAASGGAAALLVANFVRCFRDPRFRTPNWLTRQAAEAEIYTPREVARLVDAQELAAGKLRLVISPSPGIRSWRIFRDGEDLGDCRHPEITFPPDADGSGPQTGQTFRLEPRQPADAARNARTLQLRSFFYPKTNYIKANLSWPNAYFLHTANLSVGYRQRPGHAVADWCGLNANDPDVLRARAAMEGEVNFAAPMLERLEAVFRFLMRYLAKLDGLPDDALLNATPWQTWEAMRDGRGAFCECKSLIYYLFANAAGIPTRLVDFQGSIGAMVLTGHYLNESWIAEEEAWVMVDPHNRNIASVRDGEGRLMHCLSVKKRYDLNHLAGCTVRQYDRDSGEIVTRQLADVPAASMDWIGGQLVIGYKFGYPRNRRYSRLRAFLCRPTLLYSTLDLPQPRRALPWTLAALAAGLACLLLGLLLNT